MDIGGSQTITTRDCQAPTNLIKKILLWFYGLQAVLVVPMFLRGIYFHKQSLWVWEEFFYELMQTGFKYAILTVYLYIIFYLFPFFATFILLRLILTKLYRCMANSIIFLISVWSFATFIFFIPPSCEFTRNLMKLWDGWFLIFWCISTVLLILIFWRCLKKNKK